VPLHQTGRQPSADTHYPTGVRACGVERREPFQDGRQPLGGDAHAGVADNHREPVREPVGRLDRHNDLALVDELDRIGQQDLDEPSSGSTVSDNLHEERRLSHLLSIRRLGLVTEN
jgi:hypothetical protein